MDILFLITGIICGVCAPIAQNTDLNVTLFWIIMALFAVFILAYTILAIAKSRIAKINFIASCRIIGWNTGLKKEKKMPITLYVTVIICGTVLGIFILQNGGNFIVSLLASLALTFTSIGWVLMGQKRTEKVLSDYTDFMLSHNGMIYLGKAELFDGVFSGITDVLLKDKTLCLTVLKRKKERKISLSVPEECLEETENFLKDMKEFFNEQKET